MVAGGKHVLLGWRGRGREREIERETVELASYMKQRFFAGRQDACVPACIFCSVSREGGASSGLTPGRNDW